MRKYEKVEDVATTLYYHLGMDLASNYNLFQYDESGKLGNLIKASPLLCNSNSNEGNFIMLSDEIKEKWNILPWSFSELLQHDYSFLCELENSFDDVSKELFAILPDNAEFLYSLYDDSPLGSSQLSYIVRLTIRLLDKDKQFTVWREVARKSDSEPWCFSQYCLYYYMSLKEYEPISEKVNELYSKQYPFSSGKDVLNQIKELKLIQ